jgi:hypothetical protein
MINTSSIILRKDKNEEIFRHRLLLEISLLSRRSDVNGEMAGRRRSSAKWLANMWIHFGFYFVDRRSIIPGNQLSKDFGEVSA